MIPGNRDTVIGYYGFPRRRLLAEARRRHPGARLVDLDVAAGAPDAGILPATTCRIIANIVDNAIALGDRLLLVVAAVGEDKCDRGRHAAHLLAAMGHEVVESRFPPGEWEDRPLLYSTARAPLTEKVLRIMDTVVDFFPPASPPSSCEPTHGFWGVPPNDLRLLDVFPETTHVYGWTRCVEAGRPNDLDLETRVDAGVPTVFFSQSFCAKQDLAHALAEATGGLAIDCHREVNDSILAKIEAFIRLS
ncbi:MAG: hypothetical protein JW876_01480 [Candidatus Krumholzibacteriota bacterium]|nr:hypothetical protein [Candidatus Krumholzibacteriota bacterium]